MTSPVQRSDNLFVHRDTPEDSQDAKFEFTAENQKVNKYYFFISEFTDTSLSSSGSKPSWRSTRRDTNGVP